MIILLALCLTACTNTGNSIPDIETPVPTESSTDSTEMTTVESVEHIQKSELMGIVPEAAEVEAEAFPFAEMEYLFLVQESSDSYDDGEVAYYEYALLGGDWNTYEKGIQCYEYINSIYTGDDLQEEKSIHSKVFRRHIFNFSSDGERVLLKHYRNGRGNPVLYEIYEGLSPLSSYIFCDIDSFGTVNYTKGLQFVSLICDYNFGNRIGDFEGGRIDEFYQSSHITGLYAIEDEAIYSRLANNIEGESFILNEDARVYEISKTTNPADTIYYKKDSDKEGRQCIGIYTIENNELIYQSEAVEQEIDIEQKLEDVTLLDNKLIVSVRSPDVNDDELNQYGVDGRPTPYLDYYEIEMDSGKWIYLFTGMRGEFSPDGKFFAGTFKMNEFRGYQIMCLETGKYTVIKTSDFEYSRGEGTSYVSCWVKKSKISELLELSMQ